MAWNAIDDQITREFSFIQELVWSPPYRNPFPSCSNKIISHLKTFNVSLRSNRLNSFRRNDAAREVKLGEMAKILDSGAFKLIELRRSYCRRLLQLEREITEERKISDLENRADRILVQHMNNAWNNAGAEGRENVGRIREVQEIDFTALDMSVGEIFDTFQRENNIKPENLFDFKLDQSKTRDRISRARINLQQVDVQPLTEQGSCSPQDAGSEEDEETSCDESYYQSSASQSPNPVKNEISEEAITAEIFEDVADAKPCIPSSKAIQKLRHVEPSDAEANKGAAATQHTSRNYSTPPHLEVEMVMKSRLRKDAESGRDFWHIIFGLINHGPAKIEVISLSFWSIESSSSDVCSIKWPKGDVILMEGPSFLCYTSKHPCPQGCHDSPRVAFSWKYRTLEKKSKTSPHVEKKAAGKSSAQKGEKFEVSGDDNKNGDGAAQKPMYKRLGSLMFEWSASSFKKMKR